MDTYYTAEEKYLLAVEELKYGDTPKSLQLLNEIVNNDPMHARAHFQLGKIYYYDLNDYQTAGFHFKTCNELEPNFPDVYYHYLHLLQFLHMDKQFEIIRAKAMTVPGVNLASVYHQTGLLAERHKNWSAATENYRKAFLEVTCKNQKEEIEDSLKRVAEKAKQAKAYHYTIAE
jgi:tetratricopeptide (TPR) repeat protein